MEYGGAVVRPDEFGPGEWSYVAFGHYHVRARAGPRAWYSGSLDYVSTNPWGELRDEAERGVDGKGWILADLDTGAVVPQPVALARRVMDLPRLDGTDLAGRTSCRPGSLPAWRPRPAASRIRSSGWW